MTRYRMSPQRGVAIWTWLAALCDVAVERTSETLFSRDYAEGPLGYAVGIHPCGSWGLCTVLEDMRKVENITMEEEVFLRKQLYNYRWGGSDQDEVSRRFSLQGFWWDGNKQGYRDRAAACRYLATHGEWFV